MFLLKILTVFAVGFLTFRVLGVMFGAMQAAQVRVKAERHPLPRKKLAQDPRTGIYYPED